MSKEKAPEAELTTILEGIGEGFYAVDRDWRITHFNSEASRHFGRPASDMVGRVLWEIFPKAADTDLGRTFLSTMASRATVRGESMSVLVGPRWLAYRLFPLGDGMGIVFRDVTELKHAEAHRELLINELNHRVKNTLTMVQAIATQTFKGVDDGVREDFEQRLLTLSNVHSLLTDESWESAELLAVIRASLRPHLGGARERISFDGPDLRLRPKGAVALSDGPARARHQRPEIRRPVGRRRLGLARLERPMTAASACDGRNAMGPPCRRPRAPASARA